MLRKITTTRYTTPSYSLKSCVKYCVTERGLVLSLLLSRVVHDELTIAGESFGTDMEVLCVLIVIE